MLIANLLATPFTIRLLGPAQYGLWTIILTWVAWAITADVGMGPASTKIGADRYALHDRRGESAVLWTSLAIISVTATTVALAAIILAPQILHLLGVHNEQVYGPGVLALRIGCGIFIAQAIAGIVNTPLQVRLLWKGQTVVGTIAALIASIGAPAAIWLFHGGLVTAAAVVFGSIVLQAVWTLWLSARVQPSVRRPTFDKVIFKRLLSYGGALTISGILALPLGASERFFLAINHSTTIVGYWAVAFTLATTLQVIPEQLLAPLVPALSRLETVGRFDELQTLYRKALVGMFLILTPPAILLAVIAEPFLSIWAGPQYGLHATLPFLIAVPGAWFYCLAKVPFSYLLSSGRTKIIAKIQVWEVLPYIAGSWLLTAKYGAIGAALIWSGRYVIESLVYFAVVRRVAPLPTLPLPTRKFNSVAGPLALCAGAVFAIVVSHGIVLRIGWVIGLGLIYTLIVWRLILAPGERQGVLFLVDDALRRGPPPRHVRRR